MKIFWILLIVLSDGSAVRVQQYKTLQACQTHSETGEYYPLFLSPVKLQFLDVFCMSNQGQVKSLHGDVT